VTLCAESWYLDPVIQPFSTAKAYYALVRRSVGGLFKRMTIARVHFPLLDGRPVPPLGNWICPPGSRAALGRIVLLVDGIDHQPTMLRNGIRDDGDQPPPAQHMF